MNNIQYKKGGKNMFAGYTYPNQCYGGYQQNNNGVGYALILVLFILLVIIGSASLGNGFGF